MTNTTPPSTSGIKKPLLIAIALLVVLLLAWHMLLPLLGIAIAITAGVWALIIVSIAAFCVASLSIFILSGMGIAIVSLFSVVWVLISLIFFPFLFPLLIPLLILVLFISYLHRRRIAKSSTN